MLNVTKLCWTMSSDGECLVMVKDSKLWRITSMDGEIRLWMVKDIKLRWTMSRDGEWSIMMVKNTKLWWTMSGYGERCLSDGEGY